MYSEFGLPQNQRIYHYTNGEALKGIFENETIYATNIQFLNDANEIWSFLRDINEFVKRDMNNTSLLKIQLANYYTCLKRDHIPFYVVSFTTKRDSASFLSRYGEYALGIDINSRNDSLVDAETTPLVMLNVVYCDKHKERIIKDLYEFVSTSDEASRNNFFPVPRGFYFETDSELVKQVKYFWYCALYLSCFIKHKSYEDECEVRMVLYDYLKNTNVDFVTRNNAIVPIVKYALNQDHFAFDEVIIGIDRFTGAQMGALEFFFKSLVEKKKLKRVPKIEYSESNLRVSKA